ncbi:hypothetical protein ABG808_10755 [Streptococcus iniae]
MRINIVEKGPHTFYGILNAANITDNFVDYWDDFYRHVPLDYSAPIGFSTVPDGMGNFKYYTCIQKTPTDNELFEEVTLPKTTYAIFELKGSVKKQSLLLGNLQEKILKLVIAQALRCIQLVIDFQKNIEWSFGYPFLMCLLIFKKIMDCGEDKAWFW